MFTGLAQHAPGTQHNSIIRSVQYFSITIAAGNTQQDYTLPQTINKNYAAVDFPGHRLGAGTTNSRSGWQSAVKILDNNTLRAVRQDTSSGQSVTLDGYVVEFEPWAVRKRIEIERAVSGTSLDFDAMPSGQTLEAINEIQTALNYDPYYADGMTAVFMGGCTTTHAGQYVDNAWGRFRLISGEELWIDRWGSSDGVTMYGTLIQFNPGVLNFYLYASLGEPAEYRLDLSAEHGSVSLSSVETSDSVVTDGFGIDSSWYKDYGVLLFVGHEGVNFQDSTAHLYVSPSDDFRVYAARNVSYNNMNVGLCVLHFHPRWIKSNQRNKANIVGGSTTVVDQTITAVNRAKTMLQFHCVKTDNDFANVDYAQASVRFTSDTNVRSERTVASTKYCETSWQATEFY